MKYDSERISKFVPEENEERKENISRKKIILAIIGFISITIGIISLYTLKVLPEWAKSLSFGMIIVGGLLMSIIFISWCSYPMRWGGKIH